MSAGLRVTVEDLETGEKETKDIAAGDFILVACEPCYLGSVQRYPKSGTTQLTVKDHHPQNDDKTQQEGV